RYFTDEDPLLITRMRLGDPDPVPPRRPPVGAGASLPAAGRVTARSRRSRPSGRVPAAAGAAGRARSGRPAPGAPPGTGGRARPAADAGPSGWPAPPSAH